MLKLIRYIFSPLCLYVFNYEYLKKKKWNSAFREYYYNALNVYKTTNAHLIYILILLQRQSTDTFKDFRKKGNCLFKC